MHVAVIGAGALGSAIALGLAEAGCDVTAIARGSRLEWLRAHPIELESGGSQKAVQVPAAALDEVGRKIDVAILSNKAGDLAAVARQLAPRLASRATAITLQNGVEAPGLAASCLPDTKVVAGRVHGFFEMAGQRVRHVGVPPSVVLGGVHNADDPAVAEAAALLRSAGFASETSANIMHDLWEKLMLAGGLGAVAAALGVPAGQVCRVAGGEVLLRKALAEIASVASARGAPLGPPDVDRTLAFIHQFPEDATTSLQRNLMAGQPSEYDALVGAVLRAASLAARPAPVLGDIDRQLRVRLGDLR